MNKRTTFPAVPAISLACCLVLALSFAVKTHAAIAIAENNGQSVGATFLFGQQMRATDNNGNAQTVTRAGFGTTFSTGSISNPNNNNNSTVTRTIASLNAVLNDSTSSRNNERLSPLGNSQLSPNSPLIGVTNNPNTRNTTIAALTGSIRLVFDDGRLPITINAGSGLVVDANENPVGNGTQSLGTLLNSPDGAGLKSAIQQAVQLAAARVVTAGAANNDAAVRDATTQLAALMNVMSKADPNGVADLVTTAVSTLTANNNSSPAATNAIKAVVAGALSNPLVNKSAVVGNAADTAQSNGVTSVTTLSLNSISSTTNLGNIITTTRTVLDVTVRSGSGGTG